MLQSLRQNVHRSKLPKLGTTGHVVGLSTIHPHRKCIVVAYPLCDNVCPYSIGIHTIYVRFLDNQQEIRVSGIWFVEIP